MALTFKNSHYQIASKRYDPTDDVVDDKIEMEKRKMNLNHLPLSPLYNLTGDLYGQIKYLLCSKALYSVNITSMAQEFDGKFLTKYFKNIPSGKNEIQPTWKYIACLPRSGKFIDFTTYKGTKIFLVINCEYDPCLTLYVLNKERDRKILNCFVHRLVKYGYKTVAEDKRVFANIACSSPDYLFGRSQRTFEDVFIQNEVRANLMSSVNSFKNNREWYVKHRIPYHFGILLYGPPGTGKSSIISAIANEFNFIPYFVKTTDIQDLMNNSDRYRTLFSKTKSIKMIVIEDVDSCEFLTVETESKKKRSEDDVPYGYIRKNNYMSDFLNLMDGSACLENVLWVFTTNYIEKIEPSLIRAGRIDKKFLIDYATPETFKEFLKYHFNKDIEDIKLKDKTSFAEVQTDVMSGMTAEQIIVKYRE